jgi:hypothetical protein
MKHRKTLSSLAAAALLVAAIAVPVASAMPIDDARQKDMHASTVVKPADPFQDRRSEAAADPTRAPELPVGLPTWPVDPKPITPVSQAPVADGDDGGIDWQVPVIAAIGALLLAGGLVAAGTRYRATHAAG